MQVEMSLAEILVNAVAHGRIPGVQFKRGWSDERATFEGFKQAIERRLDSARRVAVEGALHKLADEHPHFKTIAENKRLREEILRLNAMLDGVTAVTND